MTNPQAVGGAVPEWTIRHRIQRAREFAELKQNELAEKLGISRATMANIEQGVRAPRRGEIIAIAFATGVNLEWLETGKTPTTPGSDGGERWGHRGSNPGPTDYGSTPSYQHAAGVA